MSKKISRVIKKTMNTIKIQSYIIILLSVTCVILGVSLYQQRNATNPKANSNQAKNYLGTHKEIEVFQKGPKIIGYKPTPINLAPKVDCIPNPETAIKIAEAIWLPIYGKIIYDETPFNTMLLKDSIWIVSGSLKEGMVGGTAYLKMRKYDGQVLEITHYK